MDAVQTFLIRSARPADAAALAEFAERSFRDAFAAQNRPADLELYLTRAYGERQQAGELADPEIGTLVVEAGGQLAGFAQLRRGKTPESVNGSSPIELWRFYVDRTWHGRGVAQSLMNAVLAEARLRGADMVWLGVWEHNAKAQAFYRKCGFVDVGHQGFMLGTDAQTDRVMSHALGADAGDFDHDDLQGILTFLRSAERLKTVTRSGWTSEGQQESVAEHTWRLCLMAMLLYSRTPGIDLARLLRMCLIHDLGEAIGGDVPAPRQTPGTSKAGQERVDLVQLTDPLPSALREEILHLWDEYEAAASPEAKLAKGLDKLETILQHTQGKNPADFDYAFNLDYGQRYTAADPLMAALRSLLDAETARRARG